MWDYENMFSSGQAVIATATSENVVKVPAGDVGKGRPLYLQVKGGQYTGAGTITVEVQTADDDAMSVNMETIATYPISNASVLKGGTMLRGIIPTGARSFLRLNYVVAGALSGGTISSGLVLEAQTAV